MTPLSETVKARVEPELRELLEREAERQGRPPANLLRRYLREGLDRDRDHRDHSRRVR